MKIESVLKNENVDNSQYVHMYFDDEVGFYVAYGLSAYLICRVVDPICSYSTSLQMPVALLNRAQINVCRRSLIKLEHTEHVYYKFQMNFAMQKDKNYEIWVDKLKKPWL